MMALQKGITHMSDENARPMTRVKLMQITPKLASAWLKRNFEDNRQLYPLVVGWYASDMTDGRWGISQDIISFDDENRLINGQHRLHAIIQSGVTIWAYVGWGFKRTDAFVMDQGRGRSLRDAISVTTGQHVDFLHLATAAAMFGRDHRHLSQQQRWDWYEKHKDAVDFACQSAGGGSSNYCRRAQITAVMARAWYSPRNRTRIKEFGEVLATGESAGKEDNAAIKLRNWLMGCKARGVSPDKQEIYFKALTALKNFIKKEPITRLFVASKELFLLPGEKPGKATTKRPPPSKLARGARVELQKALDAQKEATRRRKNERSRIQQKARRAEKREAK